MKGRNTFIQEEIALIRRLIIMRVKASERGDKSAQKRIRQQMRDIDFYGWDDYGIRDMQLADLDRLIATGQIKVIGVPQPLRSEVRDTGVRPLLTDVISTAKRSAGRRNSDESYIIDLCDEVLKLKGSRQHTFDLLRGDSKGSSPGKKLPVDAYYDSLKLVIEFAERQHTESVTFFDKPDKMTVSGVDRGIQRKIYDERRHTVLPRHGIKVITFGYSDFQHDIRKKLLRSRASDLQVIMRRLKVEKVIS